MIPVYILLVEDNKADAATVRRRLDAAQRLRCAVEHVDWLSSALMVLKNKRVDLILLDLSLPDSHGIDTVVAVRREAPNTPIIVLSGQEDINVATKSMEAGADNFIVKRPEMTSEELEREILYSMERWRRATMGKALIQKSVERLSVDSSGSSSPPSTTLISEHVDRIDETITALRMWLYRQDPALAEQADALLRDKSYYVVMQELRSLLKLDEGVHGRKTMRISETALHAVREASADQSPTVMEAESDLLRILNAMGGESHER